MKSAAPFTTKFPRMTQPISGATPPELLMLTFWNVGALKLLNVGATLPLKLTVPALWKPAFRPSLWLPVPLKVIAPLPVSVPVLSKSPAKMQFAPPAAYVPDRFMVPLTVVSLEAV